MTKLPNQTLRAAGLGAAALLATTALARADVTVGVLVPLTGELGEFGEIVANAVDLGVEQINAAGGITGCGTLHTVVADTGGDPTVGVREATGMIESDGAVAILGPTSGVMVALVDLAKRSEVVVMSPYAGTITLNDLGGDFVYRTVSSDLGDGAASGLWLTEKGYESVAFLVQNEESTISPAQIAREAVNEAGIELTDFIVYNPGQPSYQAELVSVLARDPDAIYLAGGQESGVTIIKEATSGGFTGEWLFTADLAVPEIFDAVGAQLINDRAYVEVADPDKSLDAYREFAALHAEKHDGAEPGPFAANSFDMVNLVALALEAAGGECTGAAINASLRAVSEDGEAVTSFDAGKAVITAGGDVDYEGAAGPMTFDASGTVAGSYSIKAARDGAWVDEKFIPASAFE